MKSESPLARTLGRAVTFVKALRKRFRWWWSKFDPTAWPPVLGGARLYLSGVEGLDGGPYGLDGEGRVVVVVDGGEVVLAVVLENATVQE